MQNRTKQLNIRVLLALLAVAAAVAVTIAVVHRLQIARNAGGLARLARAKVEEGKPAEAIGMFSRYLTYRPDDATAHAELARLVVEFAERPTATKNDRGYAYNVLETAVRKNPDDLLLRKQLATWMLRFGRFGDAATELSILRERLTAASGATGAEPPIDPREIDLLQARASLGRGDFQAAAAAAAAIVGFDLATETFATNPATAESPPLPENSDTTLQASLILASILDDRLDKPDAAAGVLDHLVTANPGDHRAWLVLARWNQSHKQLPRAAAAVRKAAELAPDNPDVMLTDIELCVAEQRPEVAEQLAAKARRLFPDDERVLRAQATIAVQQQQPEKAIAILTEGLAEQPGQPAILLMLADIQLQNGRLEDAEQTIDSFVEKQGATNPAVGMLQARLLIAQKRWLQARQKLESVRPLVAETESLTRQIDLLLGQCHEMLGQFDEQLAANKRVLSEDNESIAARTGVAAALAAAGKPDAALSEYEAVAASLTPERVPAIPQVWAPLLQLRIARQMKRPAPERDWKSVDQLLETLEQSPFITGTQVALLLADILVRKGDTAAAEAVLRAEVEANPSKPQPFAAFLLLTLRQQGLEAAHRLLSTAPADLTNDPLLLVARAQMAARAPAEESARELASLTDHAAGLQTDQAIQLLSAIASIYRGMGDLSRAEKTWQIALEKRPEDISIRGSLFELACEAGDVSKAQPAAADIARLAGPTSPQGRVANAAALILGVRVEQAKKSAAVDVANRGIDALDLSTEENEQLTAAKNLLIDAENDRPGWAQIQQLFAEIAGLQGDLPTAIERLHKATRLGPTNPAVIRQLVSLLYLSNRLEDAQETLALVGPDGLDGMERVSAEIDLKSGQFDNAVAVAERSLASKKNHSASDLLWFGQLLARAGKADRAEEVLQQALDAAPSQPAGWMAMFSTQLAAGQRRSAVKTLETGEKNLPSPQRELFVAQGREMLGQIDDAERSYRAAVAAAADDPVVMRSLAAFLMRRGRLTAAREELQAIVAQPRDDSAGLRARLWARRMLAEIMAQTGGYRDAERAVAMLDENVDREGRLAAEDLELQLAILAPRPEPKSWRQALVLLDRLSALQPLSNAQRTQKSQLLEQLGRWDECRDELLSIASAPGAPPAFVSLLIERLLQHREFEAARIWLKTLADRLPDAPVVAALQAKLALAQNDRKAAVAAVRKLKPGDAVTPELAGHLGPLSDLLEELGFGPAADRVLAQFAASSGEGAMARAEFLGRNDRGYEAMDVLEASWDRSPLENLLRTAVSVLRSLGDGATPQQKEAVSRWFAKARRQDPDSPGLALLHADFVGTTGDQEDVVRIYRELLDRKDIPPRQAAAVANNLAFALAAPETVQEAERLVELAIGELGPHPDVLDTRGLVLLAAGKGPEAIADLEEAVLLPSASKYLHLAVALASQQQTDKARHALAKAQELGCSPRQLSEGDRKRLEQVETLLAE
ncbi:MAG: tetratricopeptide repeat protein [Planctomycetia bacterium]